MAILFDENATRQNIILLLKKRGGMSIDELSKDINITHMGIRQHLLSLEKRGIVSYVSRKHGIGRPGFIYKLTETADELFPKSYDNFALELLKDIEKYEGADKIDRIFKWRRDRLFKTRKEALSGKEDLDDLVNTLKDLLEIEGYFVELKKNGNGYYLSQFNCPISKVALQFKDACKHELQLYRDLIGKNITRRQSLSEGNPTCLYEISRS